MKRILYSIAGLIIFFSLSGLVLAQSGGAFDLRSVGSTGGGGTSENGRFSLHGSIERQNNVNLDGGDFNVTGGTWSTVCLKAQAVTETTIELDSGQIKLNWLSDSGNFNIYRASNDPYFAPGSTYDSDDVAPWTDSENSAVGDPDNNQTYLIRVNNLCGESEISQRIGEFDFDITPGN